MQIGSIEATRNFSTDNIVEKDISRSSPFASIALAQVPRILGLCDRREDSLTQGCFDRLYWNYQITDFPSVWMQDGALLLALLYKGHFVGNSFHARKVVLEWAEKAIAFWLGALHADGSGDEVYPFERSFCATAFSAAAAAAAILVTDIDPPEKLALTGEWLASQGESDAANQVAAAALALSGIAQILQRQDLERAAVDMVHILLERQHPDGYFPEYGGFDIGYLSITLSLLARFDMAHRNERIQSAARRALAFLDGRIAADGTYDNRDCSRGTQYLYPLGFVYFESGIAAKIVRGLEQDRLINPSWLDDRYVIPMTIDYLLAHLHLEGGRRCG